MSHGLPWGTDRLGIQEGVLPRSQSVASCLNREMEAESLEDVQPAVKASFASGNIKRFSLQVEWRNG